MAKKQRTVIVVVAAVAVVAVVVLSGSFKDRWGDLEYYTVTEGEFILDVVVRGELKAERSRSVTVPPVRGRTQLVWLADEGVRIEAGEVVARIDMADLENQRDQRQQQLENEQASLDNFLASKPNQIRSAESSLLTTQYDLELAKIQLDLSEFESVQQQEQRRISYENALLRVDDAERSLASTRNKLEVDEMRRRTRIRQAQQRLDEVLDQMEQAILKAPIRGIVVYSETRGSASEGQRKVRVGDQVNRGQTVVTIPDLSEILADTRVTEGDIRKIAVDQPVTVHLDAIPNESFAAHVEEIATLASYDDYNKESFFSVRVRLDSLSTGMRPGMTASLRIITDKVEDAIYIPNSAVFDADGRTVVFPRRSMPEPREVHLGDRNLDYVIVLEGLEPGEEISLMDPREQKEAEVVAPVPGGGAGPATKNRSGSSPGGSRGR